MELALLGFANPLDPIISALHALLTAINGVTHNYGWSLIALAALVKIVFWPLNTFQFKSMAQMQALQPKIKALQAKLKGDPQKLNTEMMELYKEAGANPFAGCLPALLQMPILIALYQAITKDSAQFAQSYWGWIGTSTAVGSPFHILAANLAKPDYVLLALYVVSMYFSVRFSSPAADPQQAQQQKMMAIISPVMIGFIGFKYAWPSALILYWLTFNIFSMAQQFYLLRRFAPTAAAASPGDTAVLAKASSVRTPAIETGTGPVARPATSRRKRSRR